MFKKFVPKSFKKKQNEIFENIFEKIIFFKTLCVTNNKYKKSSISLKTKTNFIIKNEIKKLNKPHHNTATPSHNYMKPITPPTQHYSILTPYSTTTRHYNIATRISIKRG